MKALTVIPLRPIEEIVMEAFTLSVSHAAGKVVHHYRPEIVDQQELGRYHHFNVLISGEHTESSTHWKGRVVKSAFMTTSRLRAFEATFTEQLKNANMAVHSISVVYFEDQRQFGVSIIIEKQ